MDRWVDGIWQETDHRSVNAGEARREWALHAHDVLEEVARRYGRSIAYADLAAEVQRRAASTPWFWKVALLSR